MAEAWARRTLSAAVFVEVAAAAVHVGSPAAAASGVGRPVAPADAAVAAGMAAVGTTAAGVAVADTSGLECLLAVESLGRLTPLVRAAASSMLSIHVAGRQVLVKPLASKR